MRNNIRAVAFLVSGAFMPVFAELNAAGDPHEVKVPIKSSVVQADGQLGTDLRTFLAISGAGKKVRMEFLDTTDQAHLLNDWIIRRRSKQKDEKFEHELTIKRRFRAGEDTFAATVDRAKQQMSSVSGALEYQGEWSPSGLTLSVAVTHDMEKTKSEDLGDDLAFRTLAGEKVRSLIGSEFPSVDLSRARVFGPVAGTRYKGTLTDPAGGTLEVTVEVFEVWKRDGSGYEYLAEASTKAADEPRARSTLETLKTRFRAKGWLEADASKTAEIIARYSR